MSPRMRPDSKEYLTTVSAVPGRDADAAMVVTTAAPDRVGDRVLTSGLDVTNYKRNPVLLWSHDHALPPIGSVTALDLASDYVLAAWRWNEANEVARSIRAGWDGGFIRAASVGFRPTGEMVRNEFGGYDFLATELLEISLCTVPCNPEAIRELKALRLWPDASASGRGKREEPVLYLAPERPSERVINIQGLGSLSVADFREAIAEAVREQFMLATGRVD